MRNTIKQLIMQKSFLVFDGWKSSEAAVKSLGFRCAPPVKHDNGWRDRKTGFHSNDCESENDRLKLWLRARYTRLKLTFKAVLDGDGCDAGAAGDSPEEAGDEELAVEPLDLYEYAYYVNVGKAMSDIMRAQVVDGVMRRNVVFTFAAYAS